MGRRVCHGPVGRNRGVFVHDADAEWIELHGPRRRMGPTAHEDVGTPGAFLATCVEIAMAAAAKCGAAPWWEWLRALVDAAPERREGGES